MASTIPILDLIILDSHDQKLLVIGDNSYYPTGWNISNPTLQITVPGYPIKTVTFTSRSINIYNSNDLGITCDADPCDLASLPDGVYKIKYTINPAYKYQVSKNILRVNALYEKFDTKMLNLELFTCDRQLERNKRLQINEIEFYIQGAIAAANKCADKLSLDLYKKACQSLDRINDKNC